MLWFFCFTNYLKFVLFLLLARIANPRHRDKGYDDILAFFRKIKDDIVKWFKGNLKSFKNVEKVDDLLLVYIRTLKSNRLYLKALDRVIEKRVLGRWLATESEAMVKFYTSFIYGGLNESLRSGKKLSKEFEAMRKILDDALEKLPISKHNETTVLQRSVYFTEEQIKKLFVEGKDFVEEGFMSTTHSEESLFRWLTKNPKHNVILKVYGKNGKLIEKAAYDITEAEVLFKSNTTFLVGSISKIKHPIQSRGRNGEKVFQIILKEK